MPHVPDWCSDGRIVSSAGADGCPMPPDCLHDCATVGQSLGPLTANNTKECCPGLVACTSLLGNKGICQKQCAENSNTVGVGQTIKVADLDITLLEVEQRTCIKAPCYNAAKVSITAAGQDAIEQVIEEKATVSVGRYNLTLVRVNLADKTVVFKLGRPAPKACTLEYLPLCGVDQVTYANKCTAGNVKIACQGECPCVPKVKMPHCAKIGTDAEGWYVEDSLVKLENCTCRPQCRSEPESGWYSSCTSLLISAVNCSNFAGRLNEDQVKARVLNSTRLTKITSVVPKLIGNNSMFEVTGVRTQKLFGLFNVQRQAKLTVNSATGDIIG